MRLQAADHGGAGVQFRQEWLWGLRGGDGLRTVRERDSSGFKRIVEEQKVSRMTLRDSSSGSSLKAGYHVRP